MTMFAPRNSGGLPSWYGPGGARGPSGGSSQPPPMSLPPLPPPPRNIRVGSMGAAKPLGIAQTQRTGPVVNTAPTNPWLMGANTSNAPIYPDNMNDELGRVDQLMQNLQNRGNESSANLQNRLNNLGSFNAETITPESYNYNRSGEMNESFNNLRNFMQTGGFSPQDLAAIRARGVSPIRAVYGNAQRNLNRQRSLQGGYAPGMAAAATRMAREMSEQLASASTNVEAELAEQVNANRRFGAERFSSLAGSDNELMNQIGQRNVENRMRASEFNAGARNESNLARERMRQAIMDAQLQEQNRFGNEAVELARLRQSILDNNRAGRLSERNTSRAGSLNWEELNQQGGIALMNAMMQQYGPRS